MFILRWLSRIVRPCCKLKKYLLTLAWMSFIAVLYFSLQLPMKIDCRVKCNDDTCRRRLTHLGCPQTDRVRMEVQEETIGSSPTRATRLNYIEYLLSNSELSSDMEGHPLVLPTEGRERHEGPSVNIPLWKLLHRPGRDDPPVNKGRLDKDTNSQSERFFPSSLGNSAGAVPSDIGTDATGAGTGTVRRDSEADHVRTSNGGVSQNGNLVSVTIKDEIGTRSQSVATSAADIVKSTASVGKNTSAIVNAPTRKPTPPPSRTGLVLPPILLQTPDSDLEDKNSVYFNCSKRDKNGAACIQVYYGQEKKKCAKQDLLTTAVNSSDSRKFCHCIPPNLEGRLTPTLSPDFDLENLWALEHRDVEPGGEWQPSTCRSRTRLAIVVPYRDRLDHLKVFLRHMLPIFKRQLTHFRIFVVEQNEPTVFNKAAMMNVGFLEAMKQSKFDCVIFHDVDIVMEDDRSLLNCGDIPHHYAISLDRWNYRLKYETVFGAVISLRPEMFNRSNGFSNSFFGWGGEDDDMSRRVRRYWKIYRPPMVIGRYTTLNHTRDTANAVNEDRLNIMRDQIVKMRTDGLNSIRYEVKKIVKLPLFTWILANLDVTRLPYPDHVSYTYNFSDKGVCSDPHAMSVPRQRSLLTCQYDCAMEGPLCMGFNHRVDGFNRQCWLLNRMCSSYDPIALEGPASTRTYLKGSKMENKGKTERRRIWDLLGKGRRFGNMSVIGL